MYVCIMYYIVHTVFGMIPPDLAEAARKEDFHVPCTTYVSLCHNMIKYVVSVYVMQSIIL